MAACCAYGCTNRFSKKIQGITFHRFPENKDQRDLWVLAVRRKNWRPTRSTRICSEHFSEDQIDRTSYFRVRLRENAVPNIFRDRGAFGSRKKSEIPKEQEASDKSMSEFCKIAVRPTKTAPLVISVKPVSTATSTPSTSTVVDTSTASNLVTSSATGLTTALPINLFPQILSASGAPIITSPMPSIIATNVGNFLTTGLPQALTLPIQPNLTSSLTAPINPTQQPMCKEEKNVISNGNNLLLNTVQQPLSFQDEKLVDKLQRKNIEYAKKIRTLQQKVRRQRRMIERLTYTVETLKGEKDVDGNDLLADCFISDDSEEGEEEEELMEEPVEVSIKTEMRSDSPLEEEVDLSEELDSTHMESCVKTPSKNIKKEFRTTSPDEILP